MLAVVRKTLGRNTVLWRDAIQATGCLASSSVSNSTQPVSSNLQQSSYLVALAPKPPTTVQDVQRPSVSLEIPAGTPWEVFDRSWESALQRFGKTMAVPQEVVYLNGAPGSGKGCVQDAVVESRGLQRAAILSDILSKYPPAKPVMERGDLLPDCLVFGALLATILDPRHAKSTGVLIDGYPRTGCQGELLKLLHSRLCSMLPLHAAPVFRIVVLSVNEATSVNRQMNRGLAATEENARNLAAGGSPQSFVRSTDLSEVYCHKRYKGFEQHYDSLLELGDHFPLHVVDAMGSLQATRELVGQELRRK